VCSSSCTETSPSFFSGKKITQFDTWVLGGGGYSEVSEIRLNHTFPATGESVNPVLWLDTIQRFGEAGGTELALPQVTLYGDKYANRVDNDPGNGVPATYKYRVIAIRDEIGGEAEVTYGQPHPCSPIPVNNWANNTKDCFPQLFTPAGGSPGWGAFNKYLVTQMRAIDDTGISPDVVTNYTYLDTPAWHYDDAFNIPATSQSWSDFRGHSRVQVSTPGPASSTTNTVYTLFRGMDGDKSSTGTPRSVSIGPDSEGGTFTDANWFAGQTIEVAHYSPGGTFLSAELSRYWAQNTVMGQTAYTQHNAQYVRPNISITKYYDTSTENTGWHRRRIDTTYDSTYSYVTQVYDNGDTTVTGDETCAKTSTTPNSTNWILSVPYQTYTYDATCVQSNPPVIGRHDVYYDGQALGAIPTIGMPTTVGDNVDANVRALTRTGYDALGRVTRVVSPRYYAADTPATTTTYTPPTGYPTNVTVTDTKLHTTSAVPNSMFGGVSSATDNNGNTTTVARDPLGRITTVVRPNVSGTGTVDAIKYAYNVSYVSPSWVKHSVLQSTTPAYLDDYTYVDGFGHTVETQSRSPYKDAGGTITGRIVTSTRYDSQGHVAAQTQPQYEAGANGSGIVNPSPVWVHSEERSEYDALGRVVDAAHWRYNVEYWHTATNHYGTHDRIDYPVRNDVRRYTNVLGQLTRVAESLVSTSVVTDYTYTPRGDLDTITDNGLDGVANDGNVWDYDYDWLGRRTHSKDPDQGSWDTTYDLDGHVATVKDAKGDTVTYAYDELGRKTSVAKGATTLATWTYDAVSPGGIGLPATSTRIESGNAYTTAITAYDNHGRPTAKTVTIPASEGPLAGTYAYSYGYDYADHPTSVTFPAAGGLASEQVTTTYDPAGFARTMAGTSSYVSATNYTGEGRPLDRSLPSSTTRSYVYDDVAKRLTNITTTVAGATVEANRWVYDSESNVTAIVDEKVPTSKEVECFGYDVRDQLTRAFTRTGDETGCGTQAVGGTDPYDLTYTINAIGNITSVKSGAVTTSYTYPNPGPTVVRPHAVTAVGSATYHYDDNGAMDTRNGDTMTWNELHQLASYAATSGTTTYTYDADGNRLLRRVGTGPTRTLYLDGMELTAVGTGAVSGIRYYGSFAMRDSTGVTVLLRNNQGSATVAVAPNGTWQRRKYLPYGGQRGAQDLTGTERGFLDKTEDATGLVQVGARYYDPAMSVFVSGDPILQPDDPTSMGGYAYARHKPISESDPSGLISITGDGIGGACGEPKCSTVPTEWQRKQDMIRAMWELTPGFTATHSEATSLVMTNRGGDLLPWELAYAGDAREIQDLAMKQMQIMSAFAQMQAALAAAQGIGTLTTLFGSSSVLTTAAGTGGPAIANNADKLSAAAEGSEPWFEVLNEEGTRVQGIPRSFDLKLAGETFHVHPNATKHLAEYVYSHGSVQMPFSSFAGAVDDAVTRGLVPFSRNFGLFDGWELGIDTNDNVVYHAVYRGG
jgi:RHS repeat-associated protein